MHPLVSIIVPAYNSANWLAETVESALRQTWPKLEILVVDDGSMDQTLALARTYQSSNVKVTSQERQGASAARNNALAQCQGAYIQYLDADDLLSPEKIKEQVELLQNHPPGMLAITATVHFYDGEEPESGILTDGWPVVDSDDPLNWLIDLFGPEHGAMVHPGAWLVPRAVAEAAGPWNEELSRDDDGEYFARAVLASSGIRRSASGVSYYRKHRTGLNLSVISSESHFKSAIYALDLKSLHLLNRTSQARAKRALARCYMEVAVLAYPDHPAITDTAMARINQLGGTEYIPTLGSRKTQLIQKLFGWKAARKASVSWHRFRKAMAGPMR